VSIKLKVVIAVLVVQLLGAAAVWWQLTGLETTALEVAAQEAVTDASEAFASLETQDIAKLSAINDVLRTREDLMALYVAGDRDALYEASAPLFEDLKTKYGMTHWYYERPEPESTVFLRVHSKDKFDDPLTRKTYAKSVETKSYGAGKELGKTAFALRVVHPYYDANNKLIGYIEVGEEIDHFFEIMKQQTGDELAMVLLKDKLGEEEWATMREAQGLDNNWDEDETLVLADTTSDQVDIDDMLVSVEDLDENGTVFGEEEEAGGTFVRGAFPVVDVSGERVGAVIVEHNIDALAGEMDQAQTNAVLVLTVTGLTLLIVLILLLNSLVFKRLDNMVTNMEDASLRLAGGDFTEVEFSVSGNDEIGKFEQFFANFLNLMRSSMKQFYDK